MDIFFCDIRGTYTGSEIFREDSIKTFIELLLKSLDQDNSSKLYFSFVSSENSETLKKYISEFKKALIEMNCEDIIYLGKCYSLDEIVHEDLSTEAYLTGKTAQIINHLVDSEVVKNIYIADDTLLFHNMISKLLNITLTNSKKSNKIIHMIPGLENTSKIKIHSASQYFYSEERGINGLNKCILNKIENQKKLVLK